MVVLIRSNAIVGDPRVGKYVDFLESQQIYYKIIGWDRSNDNISSDTTIYYRHHAGYNVGGGKAALNRLRWFWFVIKTLLKQKNITTIHGCDLDGAFPAVIYKMLGHWNVKVVFDVFDWFSATLANQPSWIRFFFRIMECISVKCSSHIIICEEERIRQIPYDIKHKYSVLPNIPSFMDDDFLRINTSFQFNNNKPTLTYVGGLYDERFLDELLNVAELGFCNLLIAGYGDHLLEKRCKELDTKYNIKYFGKVEYKDGLNIMYNADIIYAMYCKSNPNHIYAAPNKFYEAMYLSKPIISTRGTIVGEKIERLDIGYTIEEHIEELITILKSLDINDITKKGYNAHTLWCERYKNFISCYMHNIYKSIIV